MDDNLDQALEVDVLPAALLMDHQAIASLPGT